MNFSILQQPDPSLGSLQESNLQDALIEVQRAVTLACPYPENDVRTESLLQSLYEHALSPTMPKPRLDGSDISQWELLFFGSLTNVSNTRISNQIGAIQQYLASKVTEARLAAPISSIDRALAIGLHHMTEVCKIRGLLQLQTSASPTTTEPGYPPLSTDPYSQGADPPFLECGGLFENLTTTNSYRFPDGGRQLHQGSAPPPDISLSTDPLLPGFEMPLRPNANTLAQPSLSSQLPTLSWEAQAAYQNSMRSSGIGSLSGAGVAPQQVGTAVPDDWDYDVESLALPLLPPTSMPQLPGFSLADYSAPIPASYMPGNDAGVATAPASHDGVPAFHQPTGYFTSNEPLGFLPPTQLFETDLQPPLPPFSTGSFPPAGTSTDPTFRQEARQTGPPGSYVPRPTPIISLRTQLYHLRDLLRNRQITPDETLQIALYKPSEDLEQTIQHLGAYMQTLVASLPVDSERVSASPSVDLDLDRRLLRLLKTGYGHLTAELARRQGKQERESSVGSKSHSASEVASDSDEVMSPGTSTGPNSLAKDVRREERSYPDWPWDDGLFWESFGRWKKDTGLVSYEPPVVDGVQLDLNRLFFEVVSRGGMRAVNDDKLWPTVARHLGFTTFVEENAEDIATSYKSLLGTFELYWFSAVRTNGVGGKIVRRKRSFRLALVIGSSLQNSTPDTLQEPPQDSAPESTQQ